MKTHIYEFFGKEREVLSLRELRERAGLRQVDVGKKLCVDQTTVCKWESGLSKPLKKYRKKLARLYGVTVDELLKEDTRKEAR